MDLEQVRTFIAVSELGSFIRAADRLNVTQSTVSARIKVLEDQLGNLVFTRSKNGVTLTSAGVRFERHAASLHSEAGGRAARGAVARDPAAVLLLLACMLLRRVPAAHLCALILPAAGDWRSLRHDVESARRRSGVCTAVRSPVPADEPQGRKPVIIAAVVAPPV